MRSVLDMTTPVSTAENVMFVGTQETSLDLPRALEKEANRDVTITKECCACGGNELEGQNVR
jgi:hypothetical protein